VRFDLFALTRFHTNQIFYWFFRHFPPTFFFFQTLLLSPSTDMSILFLCHQPYRRTILLPNPSTNRADHLFFKGFFLPVVRLSSNPRDRKKMGLAVMDDFFYQTYRSFCFPLLYSFWFYFFLTNAMPSSTFFSTENRFSFVENCLSHPQHHRPRGTGKTTLIVELKSKSFHSLSL
jgi:hypothetical protein